VGPPLVSILLPARDAEATLDEAVASVLAQTLGELELLAVDDGSRDATFELLRAWSAKDPRVRVLSTPGLGICGALNLGLSECRGRYVARMDADDRSLPERVERSVEALEADASLAGVGTQVEIFREDQPPSPNMRLYEEWLNSLLTAELLERERFIESPLCHPSATLRRDALVRAGGWRHGDFPEDYELWLRLVDGGGRLRAISPVLFRWRDGEERLTRTDLRYRPEAMVALKARYLSTAPQVRGRPVAIWGASGIGLRLARALRGLGVRVERLVDISPRKIGQRIDGWRVIAPEQLGPPGAEHLIASVGSKGARAEIRAFLQARGHREGPDFTCAA